MFFDEDGYAYGKTVDDLGRDAEKVTYCYSLIELKRLIERVDKVIKKLDEKEQV